MSPIENGVLTVQIAALQMKIAEQDSKLNELLALLRLLLGVAPRNARRAIGFCVDS